MPNTVKHKQNVGVSSSINDVRFCWLSPCQNTPHFRSSFWCIQIAKHLQTELQTQADIVEEKSQGNTDRKPITVYCLFA